LSAQVTANHLAVYSYGASTMSTDATFAPLVDFGTLHHTTSMGFVPMNAHVPLDAAPGSVNVTVLEISSGSFLSSPEFTVVVNVSRPIASLSPASFAIRQVPANAVNISADISGSGSLVRVCPYG
jgi:mannose/fructose/N-acetylgalactosamine-specific phosphotransferase system component IIC